jgi:hypothetical protein
MISLTAKWAKILVQQPETGMGYQIANVRLKDGRQFNRVTIVGGTITTINDDPNIPFTESDIESIAMTRNR